LGYIDGIHVTIYAIHGSYGYTVYSKKLRMPNPHGDIMGVQYEANIVTGIYRDTFAFWDEPSLIDSAIHHAEICRVSRSLPNNWSEE